MSGKSGNPHSNVSQPSFCSKRRLYLADGVEECPQLRTPGAGSVYFWGQVASRERLLCATPALLCGSAGSWGEDSNRRRLNASTQNLERPAQTGISVLGTGQRAPPKYRTRSGPRGPQAGSPLGVVAATGRGLVITHLGVRGSDCSRARFRTRQPTKPEFLY
jgi:hypothetical protein